MLPIKTTLDDIDKVTTYLRAQVGWVDIESMKKAIESKYGDNRKIEAMKFIGVIDRDSTNIKLTDDGRAYASTADPAAREEILRRRLRTVPLYHATVEWIHYQNKVGPTRTDVANYWHDHHGDLLQGAQNAALNDAVVFFFRFASGAGLGKYIGAGAGRPETYLKVDSDAVRTYAENGPAAPVQPGPESPGHVAPAPQYAAPSPAPAAIPAVTTSPGVHINVEIHIAADAKASTVEEIFKNMRKYVLTPPEDTGGDGSI